MKNKGNIRAQKKRRKERLKNRPPKSEEKVLLIDGNYSFYPVAFCSQYKAYLTCGLADTHRCQERECPKLKMIHEEAVHSPA